MWGDSLWNARGSKEFNFRSGGYTYIARRNRVETKIPPCSFPSKIRIVSFCFQVFTGLSWLLYCIIFDSSFPHLRVFTY